MTKELNAIVVGTLSDEQMKEIAKKNEERANKKAKAQEAREQRETNAQHMNQGSLTQKPFANINLGYKENQKKGRKF